MRKLYIIRFFSACLLLILMLFTISVAAMSNADDIPSEAPIDQPQSTYSKAVQEGGKLQFFLVNASSKATVYRSDKTTALFVIGKGETLVMNTLMSDSDWACVMVWGDTPYGYIKTTDLSKEKGNALKMRKVSGVSGTCEFVGSDKSYYIYSSSKSSKKIGVLRSGALLPKLPDDNSKGKLKYKAKVATVNGAGYIYTSNFGVSMTEDWTWDGMYD